MKDRNISPLDFLHFLQIEYVTHQFRKSIFPSRRDKNFHEKVMSNKKIKILDISGKNSIKNIFSSQEERNRYRELVYPGFGFQSDAITLDQKERQCLYMKDAEVVVKVGEDHETTGLIVDIIEEERFFDVRIKGSSHTVKVAVKNIRRILP